MRKVFSLVPSLSAPQRWDEGSNIMQMPAMPDTGVSHVRRLSTIMTSILAGAISLGVAFLVLKFRSTVTQPQYLLVGVIAMGGMGTSLYNKLRGNRDKSVTAMDTERKIFDQELSKLRDEVNSNRLQHYKYEIWYQPDPHDLLGMVDTRRQWERRYEYLRNPIDKDIKFGHARIGLAEKSAATLLEEQELNSEVNVDPYAYTHSKRFAATFKHERNWPHSINLFRHEHIFFYGYPPAIQKLINTIIAQLVFFHQPDELKIIIIKDEHSVYDLEYLKWLPHFMHPSKKDTCGSARLHYINYTDITNDPLFTARGGYAPGVDPAVKPAVVIFNFLHYEQWNEIFPEGVRNGTIIHINPLTPLPFGFIAPQYYITDKVVLYRGNTDDQYKPLVKPDFMNNIEMETLARAIGKFIISDQSYDNALGGQRISSFLEAHGIRDIDDIHFHELRKFGANLETTFTSVFGYNPKTGVPLRLRMREPDDVGPGIQAEGQSGMMLGRQGSGKSGVIHPLLMSILLTHGPDDLIVHLSDFKGFLTFYMYRNHPQVVGMNSNLDFDQFGIIRFIEGVSRENENRQRLFNDTAAYLTKKTGRSIAVPNWQTYDRLRKDHPELKPNPWYWIVLDEVGETLKHHEYLAEWLAGGLRTWRAQKIAIFATTQTTTDAHRFKMLIPNIGFRMITATVISEDSQAMVDSNLALTKNDEEARSRPGHGWLNVRTIYEFQAYPLVKKYLPPKDRAKISTKKTNVSAEIIDYQLSNHTIIPEEYTEVEEYTEEEIYYAQELYVELLDRMEALNEPKVPPKIPFALSYCTSYERFGELSITNNLRIPIGVLDRPQNLDQPTLYLEVKSKGLKIGGAPLSGSTSLLATIITQGAQTHIPTTLSFIIYAFNNPELLQYQCIPHVIDGAGSGDIRRLNALTNQLKKIIEDRNYLFQGGYTLNEMRAQTTQGKPAGTPDGLGDILILVDGYSSWVEFMLKYDLNFNAETYLSQADQAGVTFIFTGIDAGDAAKPGLSNLPAVIEFSVSDPSMSLIPREAVNSFAPATRRLNGNPFTSSSIIATTVPKRPGAMITRYSGQPGSYQWLIGQIVIPTVSEHLGTKNNNSMLLTSMPAAPEYSFTTEAVKLRDALPNYTRIISPIKLLPEKLSYVQFLEHTNNVDGTALIENEPIPYKFTGKKDSPHFIAFGESQSGKTNAIIQAIKTITNELSPQQARFYIMDPSGAIGTFMTKNNLDNYIDYYTYNWDNWDDEAIDHLLEMAQKRQPPKGLPPEELPLKAWLRGLPDIYIVIDNIESAPKEQQYLDPKTYKLIPLLRHSKDMNMHVLLGLGILGTNQSAVMNAPNNTMVQALLQQGADYNIMSLPNGGEYFYGGLKKLGMQPQGRAHMFSPDFRNNNILLQYPLHENK